MKRTVAFKEDKFMFVTDAEDGMSVISFATQKQYDLLKMTSLCGADTSDFIAIFELACDDDPNELHHDKLINYLLGASFFEKNAADEDMTECVLTMIYNYEHKITEPLEK